jgi:hypothetical protein
VVLSTAPATKQQAHLDSFANQLLRTMSSFREELNNYLSIPGALCVVAGGWLYLAAQHCSEEARRVSQAYVLDSLSGAS